MALQTKQVIIASKPYIDESEQGAKLLSKWPLDETLLLKKKAPAGEPRPRGRPQKITATEATILLKNDKPTGGGAGAYQRATRDSNVDH